MLHLPHALAFSVGCRQGIRRKVRQSPGQKKLGVSRENGGLQCSKVSRVVDINTGALPGSHLLMKVLPLSQLMLSKGK